jgi:hypothetical protein
MVEGRQASEIEMHGSSGFNVIGHNACQMGGAVFGETATESKVNAIRPERARVDAEHDSSAGKRIQDSCRE